MCLTPAHVEADVEVRLTLNGQQHARRRAALLGARVGGVGGAAEAQELRGVRFRYYELPTVVGVEPTAGPSAGGTVVLITGAGMLGMRCTAATQRALPSAPSGSRRSSTRRLRARRPPPKRKRLAADPHRRAAVRVSLNGGADWHAHANGTSLGGGAAPLPAVYEYECAADASPGARLLTAGCGGATRRRRSRSGENIGAYAVHAARSPAAPPTARRAPPTRSAATRARRIRRR